MYLGRNGAGKTTLLSVISAQNPASSGEALLEGKQIWENEKALSDICFSRELSGNTINGANNLKVKDYLKYAQCFLPHWDDKYANELLSHFQINKKQQINKLSKGMMSMVTIVVALASKAKYTFLDEPTAGLDVVVRNDFYKLLIEEYTESGRTFVISTHIIDEASDVFEEVIIIKDKNKIENAANGRHKLNYKFVAGIKHIGINRRSIIEKIVAERKNAKNIDGFICFWHKMLCQICFIVV